MFELKLNIKYYIHFIMYRTVPRIAEKGGRSSGLSAQHFSISSKTSGGQSRSPTNGRNGVVSWASTRSKIAIHLIIYEKKNVISISRK